MGGVEKMRRGRKNDLEWFDPHSVATYFTKKITYIFTNAKLFSNSHNFKKCNVVLHLECIPSHVVCGTSVVHVPI